MFDLYIYTIYTIYTYDLAASTCHLKQLINETHRLIGTILIRTHVSICLNSAHKKSDQKAVLTLVTFCGLSMATSAFQLLPRLLQRPKLCRK